MNAVHGAPHLFAMPAVRRKGDQTQRLFLKALFYKVEIISGLTTGLKQHDTPRKAQTLPKDNAAS